MEEKKGREIEELNFFLIWILMSNREREANQLEGETNNINPKF